MKIYTKFGDKGDTMLANGKRVRKASLRINSYGSVDEFNANIGLLRDMIMQSKETTKNLEKITHRLFRIQEELFAIGAELALAPRKGESCFVSISELEADIDDFWTMLPPLRNFVLPGGHISNSQAHLCRAICRRCERILFELDEEEELRKDLLIFFNRLSDWFFAVARVIHHEHGIQELAWKPLAQ